MGVPKSNLGTRKEEDTKKLILWNEVGVEYVQPFQKNKNIKSAFITWRRDKKVKENVKIYD